MLKYLAPMAFIVNLLFATIVTAHYSLGERPKGDIANNHDYTVLQYSRLWNDIYDPGQIYRDQYSLLQISPLLNELQDFFIDEYSSALFCADPVFNKDLSLYRYVFRLVALSYLYEAIIEYESYLKSVKSTLSCVPHFKKTIANCQPQSKEMNQFIKQLNNSQYFQNLHQQIDTTKEDWKNNIHLKYQRDYVQERLQLLPQSKSTNAKKISEVLEDLCLEDIKIFSSICSEQDHLHGISKQPYVNKILNQSPFISNYRNRQVYSCLKRYSHYYQNQESYPESLTKLFEIMSEKLKESNTAIGLQGRIFFLGTLERYHQHGLAELLSPQSDSLPTESQNIKTKSPKVIKNSNTIITAKPKLNDPSSAIEVTVEKKLSAIEQALIQFNESAGTPVPIDMTKFKFDFIFTRRIEEKLEIPVRSYLSQKSLREMKRHDQLGTTISPMSLLIIKYLIEQENHHALYNLINILGNQFYVINDVDRKQNDQHLLIQLINDSQTANKWQIYLTSSAKTKQL